MCRVVGHVTPRTSSRDGPHRAPRRVVLGVGGKVSRTQGSILSISSSCPRLSSARCDLPCPVQGSLVDDACATYDKSYPACPGAVVASPTSTFSLGKYRHVRLGPSAARVRRGVSRRRVPLGRRHACDRGQGAPGARVAAERVRSSEWPGRGDRWPGYTAVLGRACDA
jgi:hypothetical protein